MGIWGKNFQNNCEDKSQIKRSLAGKGRMKIDEELFAGLPPTRIQRGVGFGHVPAQRSQWGVCDNAINRRALSLMWHADTFMNFMCRVLISS